MTPPSINVTNICHPSRPGKGNKLKSDIENRLDILESKVSEIIEKSTGLVDEYIVKLEERIKELTNGMELDEERIAMEVAIFADKVAVDEEFTRLYSHIDQMRKTLELDEPIGRKLDFLIQEMNRETNTIGSKSSDLNITNLVVEIKSELEKIREQIQNIE